MAKRSELISKLRAGDAKIGVWGTGFIGFSSMAHFGNQGVKCVGYDILSERVEKINEGEVPLPYDMESWLGFRVGPLVDEGLIEATGDYEQLLSPDIPVHLVAVPTEKNGFPWDKALKETMENITEYEDTPEEPILVVLESTLTPGMTQEIVFPVLEESSLDVGEDILIGVAPRRDWFISADKNLRTLPRIFGGQNEQATKYMEEILGLVCEELVPAPDHEHAELVKSIENAYRHVGISLANQLARSYPDIDMRTVLALVGTKWNVPTYYPSVGTGGYCIPVASQYVLSGTDYDEELGILEEAVETDREQPTLVADAIAERDVSSVGILGLAYKGDLRVDVLSPTIPITNRLREHGIEVGVHDPFYDDEYIEEQTGASSIRFPEDLADKEALIIVADHRQYEYLPHREIIESLEECSLIVDNHRIWDDIDFEPTDIEYLYTGDKGWLSSVVDESVEREPAPRSSQDFELS